MPNLAAGVEPAGRRTLLERIKTLEHDVRRLASSVATVSRASATTLTKTRQYDLNTATFTNFTWDVYAEQVVVAPEGYTTADVLLYVTAGATFTAAGGGNVGVMPVIEDQAGPAVSNGVPDPAACSVASVMARRITISGGSVYLAAYCQRSGNVSAGSNNVHMSAQIVFSR